MKGGVKLTLLNSELIKLNKALKGSEKKINEQANVGLKRVAVNILADSQRNLRDAKSIATSQLFKSGKVVDNKDFTIDVEYNANHAYWVEFGRKAKGLPPINAIFEWIKKKGIVDTWSIKTRKQTKRGSDFNKRAISLAWAIAKSIEKNGTKAKPYLYPAFRANEKEMMRVISESIKKAL